MPQARSAPRRRAGGRRKVRKNIPFGQAHIKTSFNNTIVTLTDREGAVIAWESAGSAGFKGSRKSTPFAAQVTAEAAAQKGMEHGLEATEFFRPPQLVYPFGAHVAVVEIDRETGRVSVRDFVSVDDCGVRISPTLVAGQVHGGIAQGIAQALLEEVVYSADGQLVTGSLMDYAIPHPEDLPSFKTDQTVTPGSFSSDRSRA